MAEWAGVDCEVLALWRTDSQDRYVSTRRAPTALPKGAMKIV